MQEGARGHGAICLRSLDLTTLLRTLQTLSCAVGLPYCGQKIHRGSTNASYTNARSTRACNDLRGITQWLDGHHSTGSFISLSAEGLGDFCKTANHLARLESSDAVHPSSTCSIDPKCLKAEITCTGHVKRIPISKESRQYK